MTNKEKQKEALLNYRMLRPLYEGVTNESEIINIAIDAVNTIVNTFPDEETPKETPEVNIKAHLTMLLSPDAVYSKTKIAETLQQHLRCRKTKVYEMINQAVTDGILVNSCGKLRLAQIESGNRPF